MEGVSSSIPLDASSAPRMNPLVLGTLYCAVSTLGYTVANLCLCGLSTRTDQVWMLWIKESVSVVVVAPWILVQIVRRRYPLPTAGTLLALAIVGTAVQWLGNLGAIGAFAVVGIAVTIPIIYAVNLTGGAILGRVVLGERVTPRSALAILALVASISLLNWGADRTGLSSAAADKVRLAIAAACLAGVMYCVLGVSIRRLVGGAAVPSLVVLMITGMGTLTLAPLGLSRTGLAGLLAIQPAHLALILLAGVLNLVAFFSFTRALRLIPVVHANVLNATQVALAAVGGITLFSEQPSAMLVLGVSLTIVGICLIERTPAGNG